MPEGSFCPPPAGQTPAPEGEVEGKVSVQMLCCCIFLQLFIFHNFFNGGVGSGPGDGGVGGHVILVFIFDDGFRIL